MKQLSLISLSIISIWLATSSSAQSERKVIEQIIEIGKNDNQTMNHLDILCNRFGGRPVGSAAYDNAAEWAASKFEEWGMEVELDEAGELPIGFNRGPWFGRLLGEEGMHLHFATPSYTSGTKGVQRGHVLLEPKSQSEFDRMKGRLKGAWILISGKNNGYPIVATYDRKNIDHITFETLPTVPDIKLDEHQYKIIEQMAKERRTFELEFDIRNWFKMGPVKYHNVIGIIPGTKYPDEYVIMGGHLDSYDVATGAVDNGSGVAPAIEAARLIMKAGGKPKRTILVCLWAGEEFGLLGSRSWIKRNKEKLEKISNMISRDGGPTAPTSMFVSEAMWDDMEKICKPINGINPDFPFTMEKRKPRKQPKRAWGTASGPFAVEGVILIVQR